MCMISTDGVEGAFLNNRKVAEFDHMDRDCFTGKLVSQLLS